MRQKRYVLVVLVMMLIIPSFLVEAAPNVDADKTSEAEKVEGELASKDEVVYATLDPTGERSDIYVVNTLDVSKPGTINDYGSYSSVRNLTDLSDIHQEHNRVQIEAPEGQFYYQGNMKDGRELPWDFTISYRLNGEEMTPEELVGKDGHLQMNMTTSANENVDRTFYENYLLQVSIPLSPSIYSHIQTPDAMMANAGKDKILTFTVMPEEEGHIQFEADVVDFEMESIEISAVPSNMALEVDANGLTEDIRTLSDAINDIHEGVTALRTGVTDLNNGAKDLRQGSAEYQQGMMDISEASSELVNASSAINEALGTINDRLQNDTEEVDLSELQSLPDGLTQLADGLHETADGLSTLRENYDMAYNTLDGAMGDIPEYDITEEEIQRLYTSGADQDVLNQLIETYSAALKVKKTYAEVQEGFESVNTTLKAMNDSIQEMAHALHSTANDLSSSLKGTDDMNALKELQEGLAQLTSDYGEFHDGLLHYTEGVDQLASEYQDLHDGIDALSEGTNELEEGVGALQNGTETLTHSTARLPEQIQEEINSMTTDYDKSDFDPISFVSPKNEKINNVQFVMKTETIKKEDEERIEEPEQEEKGFWSRLLDLFF
ncbi:YhgE/Pip domain-containing protein [Caldalkalibacillus salinus]|uniref:YhgE/Pip domain-containing protein n=1 Tax=Caldalkalibacillus salinus TaxID=2803787 RepID=UPI0030172EBC